MRSVSISFGRFQGIHQGHESMLRHLSEQETDVKMVWISTSKQSKNRFLSYDERLSLLFPFLASNGIQTAPSFICSGMANTPYNFISQLLTKYNSIEQVDIVCGEDRSGSYQSMIEHLEQQHWGILFNIVSIAPKEGDPRGTDIREMVKADDFDLYMSSLEECSILSENDKITQFEWLKAAQS